MSNTLTDTLQAVEKELEPQFKALRMAMGALKQATKLTGEEKLDALAMQKAHTKLEQANELLEHEGFQTAVQSFGETTQTALESLAFDFARDLKELFEQRGDTVSGRPPRMVVNDLVLEINIGTRKAEWYYGKDALTRPIPLSFNPILKAYDAQKRMISERSINVSEFMGEIYAAWDELVNARSQRPQGGRVNIIEIYSKVIMNRQTARFRNSPSRATFKDYDRPFFIRDLVLARSAPTVEVDGKVHQMRMAIATKSQADQAMRSVWLPTSPLEGEYYANITFDE